MSSASASKRPILSVRRSARKRKDPIPPVDPPKEEKKKQEADADVEDDDDDDDFPPRLSKKQSTRIREMEDKGIRESRIKVEECAWLYALCGDVPEDTLERDYLHRMYHGASEKLLLTETNERIFKAARDTSNYYRDCLKYSGRFSDKENYNRRLKFTMELNGDGRIPPFPGSKRDAPLAAGGPVEWWDHRTDPEYKAPPQAVTDAFLSVLYPVKRFAAGGLCGPGLNVLLSMPDGTTKELEQGTPEYKQYWIDTNKKRPFQPHPHVAVTTEAYLYGKAKQPAEYDDMDKELIAKRDPYKPDGHVPSLHTYGGYHMFFRPDLTEVIALMIRAGVKIDDTIRRIYVTTEMFPTESVHDCYDSKSDRHRAITMWWILRK